MEMDIEDVPPNLRNMKHELDDREGIKLNEWHK